MSEERRPHHHKEPCHPCEVCFNILEESIAEVKQERDAALLLLRKETARNDALQQLQRSWATENSFLMAERFTTDEVVSMLREIDTDPNHAYYTYSAILQKVKERRLR